MCIKSKPDIHTIYIEIYKIYKIHTYIHTHTCTHTYIHTYQWRRKVPKSGGRGAHRHVIYVPSVKNQYKRVVFGYRVIY